MTKPQIWVSAFLVLFFLLFLLQRLTNEPEVKPSGPANNPVSQQDMASNQDMSPAELINKLGCKNCHGPNLEGLKWPLPSRTSNNTGAKISLQII